MNPQSEEDLKRRLEKLEAEINTSSVVVPQSKTVVKSSQSGFPSLYYHLVRFVTWFNHLSGVRKLIVSGVALLLGFAILQAVLKLVAAVISLALLAILVYLGYKFLVSKSSQNKQ
ncbi:MAG: hypothetical protein HC862_04950 [Scytonema sp. RU_4_4]|nr:hypothetical protein [Scytonema sp. RU_4_4]NJR73867.1 hypothetical protein [Scytonema sp. CRU_2_7]